MRPSSLMGRASQGEGKALVGISSCLLGEKVRWDGGHKRDPIVVVEIGRFVEWLPVCPEVEAGMGVPRPAVQLVRDAGGVSLRESETGRDHSAAMRGFVERRVSELAKRELCGYVLKASSPSCGLARVEIHHPGAAAALDGRGFFAEALLAALPALPVAEETSLRDPRVRADFLERVFAYRARRAGSNQPGRA